MRCCSTVLPSFLEVITIAILFSQVKVQSADQSETFLISGIPKEYNDLTESVQLERNGMKMPGATSLTSNLPTTPGSVHPVPTASTMMDSKLHPMQQADWMPSSLSTVATLLPT